jgi:outer membrane protein insertion porin family
MSQVRCFTNQAIRFVITVAVLLFAFAAVCAQEVKETRPVFELEGNKIFSRTELLGSLNANLDKWTQKGNYGSDMLDYGLHLLDRLMRSRGYLQSRVAKGNVEQTEAGSRMLLTVTEGPLYRVGAITVDGAQLFSAEQVLDEIGLKTGDVANGVKLSDGLYERLKTRYGKFGYIQYTAEVAPTFRAEKGAAEGVVDFKITIDESEQFRIHSIRIAGAERGTTDLLARELMVRDGDIFDDELFRQSVERMNRTGVVEPIDAEKDVDFTDLREKQRQLAHKQRLDNPDVGPPLVDLLIHVKKAGNSATRER